MVKHSGTSEVSRLSALAGEFRVSIGKLNRRLREQAHPGDPGDFTSAQKSALHRLERDGPATVSMLARAESVRPQSMRVTVSSLEAAGLVGGEPDQTDGRQTIFSLAPACREDPQDQSSGAGGLAVSCPAGATRAARARAARGRGGITETPRRLLTRPFQEEHHGTQPPRFQDSSDPHRFAEGHRVASRCASNRSCGVERQRAGGRIPQPQAAGRAGECGGMMAPGRTEQARRSLDFPAGWTDLIPELNQQPTDHTITKYTPGAFTKTALEEHLRGMGVTQVVLAGISTSSGVESTTRQAYECGFHVTLAIDAMTDLSLDAHTHSLTKVFPRLGETGRHSCQCFPFKSRRKVAQQPCGDSVGHTSGYPFMGALTKRFGIRKVSAGGAALALAGTLPLIYLASHGLVIAILACALFIRGMGLSAVGVPSISAAYASVVREDLPMATTALNIVMR
ncbi:MAG: isochorismatase family protein, partial [Acidithiobacillus ferriphilus]